jgi:glutathione S-transferase
MDTKKPAALIKLTYFDVRGRIEPARLMLEMTGTPYDFEPIPVEVWPTPEGKQRFFSRTPLGQLPILEDGSLTLCQSQAIDRYLASKLGLYGSTPLQNARIDEVTETAGDLLLDLGLLFWDPRIHERRAEHRETLRAKLGHLQNYFQRVAVDAEHWIFHGRYTLADVRMSYALENTLVLHAGLLQEFPLLHHAMMSFFNLPGVRQFVRSDRRSRTYTVSMAPFAGKPEETHQFTESAPKA